MFQGLQVVRFFAAASVLSYHCAHYAGVDGVIPASIALYLVILARGVVVFFVLSGFLMAMLMEKSSPGPFILNRVVRIYPPFFGAVLLMVILRLATDRALPQENYVAVLSLMPTGPRVSIVGVEWTLVYEMFFYIVTALLCFLRTTRQRQIAVGLWALGIVVTNEILHRNVSVAQPAIWQIPFSWLDIMFIGGMAGWWLRDLSRTLPPLAFALAGTFMILTSETWPGIPWLGSTALQIFGSVFILWSATSEQASRLFKHHSVLPRLGDGSYGVYLTHVAILTAMFAVIPAKGYGTFFMVLLATLALGTIYGIAEYEAHQRIKRLIDRLPPLYVPAKI